MTHEMSKESLIFTRRNGHVLEITLNRPPVNAINEGMSRAIYNACKELMDDPNLRVGLIHSGMSRVFSAGLDLKELAVDGFNPQLPGEPAQDHGPGGFAGITEFFSLLKPVVAAVNGAAVGGGFEIALASDIVVMAETAFFQLPEMKLGLLPEAGGVQRLPRRVPHNIAVEFILTGRRMGAEEAQKWGLVQRVAPPEQTLEVAREVAQEVAKGAPLALQAFKEILHRTDSMHLAEAMAQPKIGFDDLPVYQRMIRSEDLLEGARAFEEKRDPHWRGL